MSTVIVNNVEVSLVSRDGLVFANSLDVANVFEKPHKDVLSKIRNFSERAGRNFSLKSYVSNGKELPSYEMTRDGFMFLAMGFTGEKADNWKFDLIDAFNLMEKQSQRVLTIPEQIMLIAQGHQNQETRIKVLEDTKRLENWQERSLHDAKNQKVYEIAKDDKLLAAKLHRKVWSLFKKRFNLPRYNELAAIKYQDGLSYLQNLTLADLVA
jgi:Rha family phage regulatory protein